MLCSLLSETSRRIRRTSSLPRPTKRKLGLEPLECRALFAGDLLAAIPEAGPDTENPGEIRSTVDETTHELLRLDVNRDGSVSPADALKLIDDLNRQNRERPWEPLCMLSNPPICSTEDVNRDGILSPLDALLVINFLNDNGQEPVVIPDEVLCQDERNIIFDERCIPYRAMIPVTDIADENVPPTELEPITKIIPDNEQDELDNLFSIGEADNGVARDDVLVTNGSSAESSRRSGVFSDERK